ncbi:prepilin-like proteins leader peptide-processing enzyme, type 4 [Gottschalkia acidurici 9a]|uniref:Prepilin leader peptidase/N-methyltransferase n=1 Tax=Gottschalkia acidurici (strain ATCC 7906 / DSM 604 / BCRC 14475 / CIP 104303 / KCTC 5404 / NCIMB 10678 / 9a) TaxID=1128398 RepID=K0AZK7_GOTA9|nr:A24 family peptidase [Gottschalkia acidurici]AFS77801.1 prepilin-like proteins leader peptide-processing enzyme, type 4 [Gottschalkia acidurici 9a]
MQLEAYLFILIIGLMIGSFLNVCIYRIPRKESIVFPSSHCFSCKNKLRLIDLFPVLSYIFLRGKCRYCGKLISIQYPLIEVLNSTVYLLLFLCFGISIKFVFYALLTSLLIVISSIDYYHQIIPGKLTLLVFIWGIIYKIYASFYMYSTFNLKSNIILVSSILGFLVGGGFYYLILIISKGNMGGGDIKLMAALGIWLGWEDTFIAIFITFMLGAIISILLLVTKIKSRKDPIPFGPFIVLGTLITIIYKQEALDLYFKITNLF